jgi:hypothetical protein
MKNILILIFLPLVIFGQQTEESSASSMPVRTTVFNVMDYGAKGIGSKYDDTDAFQAAFKAAIAVHGKVIIPSPPSFYNLTNTIEIVPARGAQCYVNVEAWGHTVTQIRYTGPGNRPVFKVLGLKSSIISGVKVVIAPGPSNIQVWDIDTDSERESTSHVTFKSCISNLGDGINNVGWRLGHLSAGSYDDISNYQWENCAVYGHRTGKIVSGQIGWLVEGPNTLSNTWMGGFGAFLDKIYSNFSTPDTRAGTPQGNGSVYFYGLGGSHNNIDFEVACSGTYLISGGRFEVGKTFLNVRTGSDHPAITLTAVQLSTYTPDDGCVFNMDRPGTLILDGCRLINDNKSSFSSDMIRLGGFGKGRGSLIVRAGAYPAAKPFYVKKHPLWKINIESVGKFSGVHTTEYFEDVKE